MRTALRVVVAAALVALVAGQLWAEEPELTGRWKLVVFANSDTEMLILDSTATDGKLAAKFVAGMPNFAPEIKLTRDGQRVSLLMSQEKQADTFEGTFAKQGPREGQVLGALKFRERTYPARLEHTEAGQVGRPMPLPEMQAYSAALRQSDPKVRIEKLRAAVKDAHGPVAALMYNGILQNAVGAELSAEEVRQVVDDLLAVGKDYGAPIVAEYQNQALKALQGKKPYAELTLTLAQEADKSLGAKASLQQQAAVLSVLASSAHLLNKADLAAATDARLAKIETALDEEYHSKVPPFKPEAFAGRAQPDQDRVVLMELFTGAQCPPCVAADVAFDALIKSYQPKELVTLQYHLHVPGPDPLTNADAEVRSKYYAVRGTPTTLFNGVVAAGGGGGMANAEAKFGQYREVIDGKLADQKQAKIDLRVTRSGANLVVVAVAQASKPAEKEADDKAKEPQLRLRLVLTEELIRYVGGNQLRFHHHVVRGFPGGVEGKELVADECTANETIDLNQVRKTLEDYVANYPRGFPHPLPSIDLKDLSVVAFVQNDADKSVLHAVSVSVPQN